MLLHTQSRQTTKMSCLFRPCTVCLMYEMEILSEDQTAADTYQKDDQFTCKRCQEQQQEHGKKERMKETIEELKKKIEELQVRITTLTNIKDAENIIDSSYNALQSTPMTEEQLQDLIMTDAWTITDEEKWTQVSYKKATPEKQFTIKKPEETDFSIQLTNKYLVLADQSCNPGEKENTHVQNTTAEEKTSKILFIGDSIVRHIKLQKNKEKISKICCSGKKVKEVHERATLAMKHHKEIDTVIFHAGVNDLRYKETETLKTHFRNLAADLSNAKMSLVISGPLPMRRRGCEAFSRLLNLNEWLKTWCTEQSLTFVDNFDTFWENPNLLGRDGLHPTQEGANAIAENIMNSLKKY